MPVRHFDVVSRVDLFARIFKGATSAAAAITYSMPDCKWKKKELFT